MEIEEAFEKLSTMVKDGTINNHKAYSFLWDIYNSKESAPCSKCRWNEKDGNYCFLLSQEDMEYCNKFQERESWQD